MTPPFDINLSPEHVYTDGEGRVIPSTTQIINEVRSGFRFKPNRWFLDRGTAIHKSVELAIQGKLDMTKWEKDLRAALTPPQVAEILGKTKAALLFLTENMQADRMTQETILHNRLYNYCGKTDLIGYLKDGRFALCDWKSSLDKYVQPQLGSYSLAMSQKPDVAVGVELRGDGTYRCMYGSRKPKRDSAHFDLEHAERIFTAMLTYRGWLAKNNLLAAHMQHVEEMYNAAQ